MMGVHWSGLEEFYRDLGKLGPDLAHDGNLVAAERAQAAAEKIRAGYPKRSGYLAAGVFVKETTKNILRPRWTVRNDVIYANVFETGPMARHTATDAPGPKPAGKVFVPTAQRERRAMVEELKALLRVYGATTVS